MRRTPPKYHRASTRKSLKPRNISEQYPQACLLPGTNNILLLEAVGEGAFGITYKGYHQHLNKFLAIKIAKQKLENNDPKLERFKREARLTSELNHPQIVRVYQTGIMNSQFYYVMEFVDGITLTKYLENLSDKPESYNELEIIDLLQQCCSALATAHHQKIIHRDLKPENILLTPKKEIKITDFGLAKHVLASEIPINNNTISTISTVSVNLTQEGEITGTPLYGAPEQFDSTKDLTTQCDIYSLGATFYEVIGGKTPYDNYENVFNIITQLIDKNINPTDLTEVNPQVSKQLSGIISKMMHKSKVRRYKDVSEIQQDLFKLEQKIIEQDIRLKRGLISYGCHKIINITKSHPLITATSFSSLVTLLSIVMYISKPKEPPRTLINKNNHRPELPKNIENEPKINLTEFQNRFNEIKNQNSFKNDDEFQNQNLALSNLANEITIIYNNHPQHTATNNLLRRILHFQEKLIEKWIINASQRQVSGREKRQLASSTRALFLQRNEILKKTIELATETLPNTKNDNSRYSSYCFLANQHSRLARNNYSLGRKNECQTHLIKSCRYYNLAISTSKKIGINNPHAYSNRSYNLSMLAQVTKDPNESLNYFLDALEDRLTCLIIASENNKVEAHFLADFKNLLNSIHIHPESPLQLKKDISNYRQTNLNTLSPVKLRNLQKKIREYAK